MTMLVQLSKLTQVVKTYCLKCGLVYINGGGVE